MSSKSDEEQTRAGKCECYKEIVCILKSLNESYKVRFPTWSTAAASGVMESLGTSSADTAWEAAKAAEKAAVDAGMSPPDVKFFAMNVFSAAAASKAIGPEEVAAAAESVQQAVSTLGPRLQRAVSSPYFSHDDQLSFTSYEDLCYDESYPHYDYHWGGYAWKETWYESRTSSWEIRIFHGMDGKTLKSILEAKIPELMEFVAAKVVTIHPARSTEGLTLTCNSVSGDTVVTFQPSEVSQMNAEDLESRVAAASGGAVTLVLPDGSKLSLKGTEPGGLEALIDIYGQEDPK
eukprot:TRINITY_DN90910_c0_g1_i1.p1 TRINITY_DN90910_c0_g1~~TRINITY_DN90910_c0_g1_i1.p1  ORF type:complete len:291 (-),score=63.96 TRINITY_DN90910_c0_g1_i1:173-1045(-)